MGKILITGGAGFIGSHVARRLLDQGHEVVVFDLFVQYVYPMSAVQQYNAAARFKDIKDRVRIVRGNTQNLDFLIRTFKEIRPTRIIHLAAMPLVKLAMDHPEEAATAIVQGTINVLQAARYVDTVERVVYISSSMVYGDFKTPQVDEEHSTKPKEIYGGLKLSGEILTRVFAQRFGIDFAIVRPSGVYGPTDNNARVLSIFLKNALAGKPLNVHGVAVAIDFTYVTDIADGIILVAMKPEASMQTFNITRGNSRTTLEAAKIVADLVPGTQINVMDKEEHLPDRGTLDISRARTLLGYNPRVDLEQGLSMYHAFIQKQEGIY